jgi:ubiquinone/menaquinone biosynthesis C-methylase UbiE
MDVLKFEIGNVESLAYADNSFDRVIGTCVLHHIGNPFEALQEIRRVTMNQGEICFVLPTDPGILNRLIKKIITFPKLRKISHLPPELLYALDHQNHIESIIQMFRYVFREDEISIQYSPFALRSWNLNLLVTLKARKN